MKHILSVQIKLRLIFRFIKSGYKACGFHVTLMAMML